MSVQADSKNRDRINRPNSGGRTLARLFWRANFWTKIYGLPINRKRLLNKDNFSGRVRPFGTLRTQNTIIFFSKKAIEYNDRKHSLGFNSNKLSVGNLQLNHYAKKSTRTFGELIPISNFTVVRQTQKDLNKNSAQPSVS
ncbi:hypothetical protein BpHYR1_041397 [Brachionus plicatilis]|uniref:Uncharacterized protein n=1 Tax=Brachionus plicatilis TaxID=10195 RepID=A0A3M7QLL7_BRAPC|nr:hypothetical protein BpHYR1_041397 [Brachionus plicatilis]